MVDRRTLLLGGGALTALGLAGIARLLAQEDTVPGRVVDTSSGGIRGLTRADRMARHSSLSMTSPLGSSVNVRPSLVTGLRLFSAHA